ncbi:MAG: hypothetical protein HFJ48_03610 [Clostridia bacterium]|nr:hypothetical protein [Clostridia bacterium]
MYLKTMTQNIKKEIEQFFTEIEKNVKNPENLRQIKEKTNKLISVFLEEMDKIIAYEETKIEKIEEKQKEMEKQIEAMRKTIENIEKDIYIEDEYDFDIICPYCDYEFAIEYNEEEKEAECPQCHNIVELDWSGDIEEETGCSGNCSQCGGCLEELEENDIEDDEEE